MDGKVIVITGSASGIGRALKLAYEAAGAVVFGIDLKEGESCCGDVGRKEDLDRFLSGIKTRTGKVDVLIHNSPPSMLGIDEADYGAFQDAMNSGVTAGYYLCRELRPYFAETASVLFITSTRAVMSQRQSETYSAAKGALNALVHALAVSLGPAIRVNGIAPGWIDTSGTEHDPAGPDCRQHPVGRIGCVRDIVAAALFLTSDFASFITGEILTVDGGMSRRMIYHGDEGWSLR